MTSYRASAYGPNPNAGVNVNADHGWGGYQWPGGVPPQLLGTASYNGVRSTVRRELVTLYGLAYQIAAMHGYTIHTSNPNGNGEPWGPWGYENRPISGTNTASNHSKGKANDWNAPYNGYANGFANVVSDFPPAMVADIESIGLCWGGRYGDAMHWEYGYSPAEVAGHEARARSILGQKNTGTDPAPLKEDDDIMKVFRNRQGVDYAYSSALTFFRRIASNDEYYFLTAAGILDVPHGSAPVVDQNLIDEIEVQVRRNQKAAGFLDNDRMLEILRAPEFALPGLAERAAAAVLNSQFTDGFNKDAEHPDGWSHPVWVYLREINRRLVEQSGGPAAPVSAPATYVVVAGDTFNAIAKAKGITPEALKAANPGIKDVNNLDIGAVLVVPKA